MATKTLGTAATNTLTALAFAPGYNSGMSQADVATIALAILRDQIGGHPIAPEAFSSNGLLYVPDRGLLKVLPGDFVGVDAATGWPILVSARAAAGAGYVHS